MRNRKEFISLVNYGWHKGFYIDGVAPEKSLFEIYYSEFFEESDDDEFPYSTAHELLCGSCHHFAWGLQRVFGYHPYIIEGNNHKGFHAFCQIYKKGVWYYIDARGVSTSFDEFMTVASRFVSDEYTIRPVEKTDFDEWEKEEYNSEGLAFAEMFIREYRDCYII